MSFVKEKSHALLIGVGKRETDSPAMAISAEDAGYLEKALKVFDFFPGKQITNLRDEAANSENILQELNNLAAKTKSESADFVLVFFSGHGSKKGDEYHLICRNTSAADLHGTAISGAVFARKLNEINCKKMLVLLDCCHAEGIKDGGQSNIMPFEENTLLARENRVILTACSRDQVSYLSRPLSVFTYAVIEGLGGKFLRKEDKEVNVLNLAMDVRERVVSLAQQVLATGTKQQPQLNILEHSGTTNFTLAHYPTGAPQKIKILSDTPLQSFDGTKDFDMDTVPVRDEEYREKFNWILIQNFFSNVGTVNQKIIIQTVNNNMQISSGEIIIELKKEVKHLQQLMQKGFQNIFYRDGGEEYRLEGAIEQTFEFLSGRREFNQELTRRLMEAFADNDARAKDFLQEKRKYWDHARNYIVTKYGGVLSFQLRRLMAIGNEPLSKDKLNSYTLQCLITAKRALQVLTFSLISKLWALKARKPFSLKDEYKKVLEDFFAFSNEKEIQSEVELLRILYAIFEENLLELPIPEIRSLNKELTAGGDFTDTCFAFKTLEAPLRANACTIDNCFQAENLLSVVLEKTIFLADYKMISIKEIFYQELPYDPPSFFHNYTEIGKDQKDKSIEKVTPSKKSVWTDAILLFKSEYQDSVNLFPFIIDLNALRFESGTKIYLYSNDDKLNNNITYRFIENDSEQQRIELNESKTGEDEVIGSLRGEAIQRLKFNKVFQKLREARETILS
jgi:hypothetical protein